MRAASTQLGRPLERDQELDEREAFGGVVAECSGHLDK
jgi:hypothetical protein